MRSRLVAFTIVAVLAASECTLQVSLQMALDTVIKQVQEESLIMLLHFSRQQVLAM